MLIYANTRTLENMTETDCIDVLGEVRDDVSGVSECLRSLSELAKEVAIEPATLAVLSETLSLAADALNVTIAAMDSDTPESD